MIYTLVLLEVWTGLVGQCKRTHPTWWYIWPWRTVLDSSQCPPKSIVRVTEWRSSDRPKKWNRNNEAQSQRTMPKIQFSGNLDCGARVGILTILLWGYLSGEIREDICSKTHYKKKKKFTNCNKHGFEIKSYARMPLIIKKNKKNMRIS